MNIPYDYYKIFYYVAKYQSFSKAASVLMNNQPNLTRSVQNLEHALGCQLFIRSNRGVHLTSEGELLYAHVSAAVTQLMAGEESLKNHLNLQEGIITIGVSETALHGFLLQKLSRFRSLYPGVRIRISNHSTPQAVLALKNQLVDFAVVTTPSGIRPPLEEIPLKTFRELLAAGPRYFSFSEKKRSLKQLLSLPFVCHDRNTKSYEYYSRIFLQQGLDFSPDMEAATTDQVLLMIKNNLGIGFLPEDFAQESLSKGEIREIPLQKQLPLRSICLIRDTNRVLSIAASKMIAFLYKEKDL